MERGVLADMMEESLAALEARIRDLDPAGPFTLGVRVALEEAVSALAEQNCPGRAG